ncbi:MAG: ATP-binding cassette domain-containing protein [Chlorobiaceae bacterium]|nr:ATP-binding cassette domain-containing protein [Chlorobiaceae bacterium]NTV60277.1 ATP-binding cassette domain-containing protein [Chlorobiaceae bacterium]
MIRLDVKKNLAGSGGPFTLSLDLCIEQGTLQTLYGRSGSGKTTLLRILAGLVTPESGCVEVNGATWFDSTRGINLPARKRRIGFVFQDYSLFPTMTIRENLLFAQDIRNTRKVGELLDLIDLGALADRYPSTLSGGQQQRVALARAVLREPEILLLDEPLSALDQKTRVLLQDEILRLHKAFNLTTILVSHDKLEVFKLSDRVAVLETGKIIRSGNTLEVFMNRNTSNKFSFAGTILSIRKADCIYLAVIGSGNELFEAVLTENDMETLRIGDEVLVASKAFNPVVIRLTHTAYDADL